MKLGIHGLPLRSAVIAKRRRRLRILAAIAALGLFGFIAGVAYEIWPERARVMADVTAALGSPAPAAATPVAATVSTRPIYRHSIVPGGAYSRREVADAMRKDAVVASHYQDVDVDKVHTKTLTAARAVYVSYRVGSQVYWTKNRVHLAAGETVLTDGKTEIRARCGNLLSDNAQAPVAAEEPPVAQLDEAERETGASTFAAERGPEDQPTHVPFMTEMSESSTVALNTVDPDSHGTLDTPMWFGGAGGAIAPFVGSSTGTNGTSLVTPLGSGGRPNNGTPNGGGSNGGGSNGGGSNGGGSNGGGSNGGGSNGGGNGGGGNPPTTTGGTDTTGGIQTTGGTETPGIVTTTTGNVVSDTTGGSDGTGQSVPEPTTMVLLGLGLCGAAVRAVRRNRQ